MARTKRVSRGRRKRVQSKRMGKKRTKRSSKSSSRSNKRMRRSFIKKSRGRSRRSLRRMRGGMFMFPSAMAAQNKAVSGQVTVKDITTRTKNFEMDSTQTIDDLKKKIVESSDVWKFENTEQFRLIKDGIHQMKSNNVVIGSTYTIVLSLPPGHPMRLDD